MTGLPVSRRGSLSDVVGIPHGAFAVTGAL